MRELLKRVLSASRRAALSPLDAEIEDKAGRLAADCQEATGADVLPISAAMPEPPARRKSERILDALSQDEGASIEQLCALTGWTRHAVRARLSRLRKSGLQLEKRVVTDRDRAKPVGRIYRVMSVGASEAQS